MCIHTGSISVILLSWVIYSGCSPYQNVDCSRGCEIVNIARWKHGAGAKRDSSVWSCVWERISRSSSSRSSSAGASFYAETWRSPRETNIGQFTPSSGCNQPVVSPRERVKESSVWSSVTRDTGRFRPLCISHRHRHVCDLAIAVMWRRRRHLNVYCVLHACIHINQKPLFTLFEVVCDIDTSRVNWIAATYWFRRKFCETTLWTIGLTTVNRLVG